jgi:hypothetical protein
MEVGKRVYRDAAGNIGLFRDLYTRPYYGLCKVLESSNNGAVWDEVDPAEYVNVMHDSGIPLDVGKCYVFTFDVYPYSRIREVKYTGPVFDIVGKDHYKKSMVINPQEKYEVYGSRSCANFTVKTNVAKPGLNVLSVVPSFDAYTPEADTTLPTLESRLRDLPTDLELCLSVEGEEPRVFEVHSFVVRSCTAYFDVATSFKENNRIQLNDRYSAEAWAAVVEYMYSPVIKEKNIGVIQEMIQIGDEYQINFLVISGARRIRDYVEDSVSSNCIPWAISIISMTSHFVARHDPAYENDMVELCKAAIFLVHSRAHDLLQDLGFVEAYSEIIPLLREMNAVIESRNASYEEYAKKPISILGKRKWDR